MPFAIGIQGSGVRDQGCSTPAHRAAGQALIEGLTWLLQLGAVAPLVLSCERSSGAAVVLHRSSWDEGLRCLTAWLEAKRGQGTVE